MEDKPKAVVIENTKEFKTTKYERIAIPFSNLSDGLSILYPTSVKIVL